MIVEDEGTPGTARVILPRRNRPGVLGPANV